MNLFKSVSSRKKKKKEAWVRGNHLELAQLAVSPLPYETHSLTGFDGRKAPNASGLHQAAQVLYVSTEETSEARSLLFREHSGDLRFK